jgi:outer membrane protein assembly factor BamB
MIITVATFALLVAEIPGKPVARSAHSRNNFLNPDTTAIKDSFWVDCADISTLPPVFQKGYIMVYQRQEPGAIVLLSTKGEIMWSYQSSIVGFKVVRFTKKHSLLCITGTKENQAGYGNAILELSLKGDTLLHLTKGQKDFQQAIHHEILLNAKDQVVTLCREERIVDLRSKGGLAKDTVYGDGILVLDRLGRRVWKWTVFDKLDPLSDDEIMAHKKDWMHANSIAIDKDGNYLISFYNNGQIWNINAVNGNVNWKFGRHGDFEIPPYSLFDQAHAVHINKKGWLMFFDNGANKKQSRSLAFELDKSSKKATPMIHAWLPPALYTDRMGSSYLINDTSLLVCASRHKTVALTNLDGTFLWQLKTNRITSYRAEFIPREMLSPYMKDLVFHTTNN